MTLRNTQDNIEQSLKLISVVIPVYKKVDEFINYLDHNLMYLKDSEIIVINDDPYQSIKNRLSKYNLRLIENSTNLGFAGTIDIGVRLANHNFVFLLNSDVKLLDSSFQTTIKNLRLTKNIRHYFCTEGERRNYYWKNKLFWNQGLLQHTKADNLIEGETGWVEGGSSIIRKDLYEQIGGFDSIFSPFYWEDIELSYRARKHGYITWFDPTVLVEHHHESTIGAFWSKDQIKTIAYRNQLLCSWKNIKDTRIIFHFLFLISYLIRSIINRDFPFIYGFFKAIPFLFSSRFYKIR
ncbi:glycosyltransferase family 2 protein [Candidatus Roizmanbacteria bacterium]|nr:MAG: glycosyltransferase family 2 protein [Candidatus Roizmanbacteria bacterium]